jgi:hypothetical protein
MKTNTDGAPQVRAFYHAAYSLQRMAEERLPRRRQPDSVPPIEDEQTPDGVELAPASEARPG